MLRADAEMRWLSREVIPAIRELERREGFDARERGAAAADLEVLWMEAQRRASATEAARAEAETVLDDDDDELYVKARRFREAVVTLRETVARRLAPLLVGSCADAGTDRSVRGEIRPRLVDGGRAA